MFGAWFEPRCDLGPEPTAIHVFEGSIPANELGPNSEVGRAAEVKNFILQHQGCQALPDYPCMFSVRPSEKRMERP